MTLLPKTKMESSTVENNAGKCPFFFFSGKNLARKWGKEREKRKKRKKKNKRTWQLCMFVRVRVCVERKWMLGSEMVSGKWHSSRGPVSSVSFPFVSRQFVATNKVISVSVCVCVCVCFLTECTVCLLDFSTDCNRFYFSLLQLLKLDVGFESWYKIWRIWTYWPFLCVWLVPFASLVTLLTPCDEKGLARVCIVKLNNNNNNNWLIEWCMMIDDMRIEGENGWA